MARGKMLWDRIFQIIKVFHEKYFYNPLMGVTLYTSDFFTLTTRYGSDNKLQTFFIYFICDVAVKDDEI